MIIFVNIATLFVIGSLLGYVLEILYRRFVSTKRWINPGFLIGPYIPIYGFGVLMLYSISIIPFPELSIPNWALIIIKILIIGIILTLIELIGGLIFIKGFHIKLWDYSKRWLNYQGIICPLFSLIWTIIGSIYIFFIQPYFLKVLDFFNSNLIYTFFIGLVVGMMLVDAAYSFHLGLKIKNASEGWNIKYEQFKVDIKEKRVNRLKSKKGVYFPFFLNRLSSEDLKLSIEDFIKHPFIISKKIKKKQSKNNPEDDATKKI